MADERGTEQDGAARDRPEEVADRLADGPGGDGAAPHHHSAVSQPTVLRRLLRALAPRLTRAQLLAALLSGVVGFALVVQVTQNQSEDLASLRQSDLVRLLDEVSQRSDALTDEKTSLESQVSELQDGSDTNAAALKAATQAAQTQGILSGRLPATGPGIRLDIVGDTSGVQASDLLNVLEELRNAGAEVIAVNHHRIVVSSSFVDGTDGIRLDGVTLDPPYRWQVIGEPTTLQPALEIPGGALSVLRNAGAEAVVTPRDKVTITDVVVPQQPVYATPSATS